MTLQQLRYLREIVRRDLNISKAAAALHITQPGLSRQLRLLEEELGIELFVRTTRHVELTAAGSERMKAPSASDGSQPAFRASQASRGTMAPSGATGWFAQTPIAR